MRKVHRAERRRRDWRRRWCGSKAERDEEEDRSHGSHGSHLEDEEQDEGSAQGSAASMRSLRTSAFAGRNLPGTEFLSKMSDTLQSMQESLRQHATRALEKNRSQQSEERVDEAVDWQIGRLSVKGLNVTLNKKQRLTLGEDGWDAARLCRLWQRAASEAPLPRRVGTLRARPGCQAHSRLGCQHRGERDSVKPAPGEYSARDCQAGGGRGPPRVHGTRKLPVWRHHEGDLEQDDRQV